MGLCAPNLDNGKIFPQFEAYIAAPQKASGELSMEPQVSSQSLQGSDANTRLRCATISLISFDSFLKQQSRPKNIV
jgi:hypothetical protein